MAATFMPKPFGNLTGSGLHLHSSLWDAKTGAELFADSGDPAASACPSSPTTTSAG